MDKFTWLKCKNHPITSPIHNPLSSRSPGGIMLNLYAVFWALSLNNISTKFIAILCRSLQITTSLGLTSPPPMLSVLSCLVWVSVGLSWRQMRYGPSNVEMRNLPVMGPLWFTAHWMPVPRVYSPPGHIPCSISLSTPLSGCSHPRAYNGNPPQTPSLTDGKRKLRLKDGGAKEREGKGKRKEVGSESDLAELCSLCEVVVTTETLPLHTEARTQSTFSQWDVRFMYCMH